ncbi:MAG TPA: patatin-like phospholipase family protein [Alphaproteobacteria bacterium]|nr:patatin-like phospholipase family protein [Alphaproteobacteria bacterium]
MADDAKPMRVLALDGGGIRGVISATIVAYLEDQAQCAAADLFDLVVGTSTGGILSLGLTVPDAAGRPKFSARDLATLYVDNGRRIFQPWGARDLDTKVEDFVAEHLAHLEVPGSGTLFDHVEGKPVPWWRGLFHPKYSADGLEAFLQQQLGESARLSGPVAGTHVAANSYALGRNSLQMFRSWEAQRSSAHDFPMWAVGRATSAAPTFFPPAALTSIDGATTLHCIDGAVAVNDPVLVGYAEASHLQRALAGSAASAPILVVSVGTGAPPDEAIRYDKVKDAGILGWFINGLMDVLIDGPNVAANRLAETVLPDGSFYRFQAPLSGPGFAADSAMDDCSGDNLTALRKAAEYVIREREADLEAVIEKLRSGGTPLA